MPARLPAPAIHLLGILRPRLLRPDVRAPSIAQLDWPGLRRAGWNAVVVDKDNCVTLPHSDTVFPPYTSAWATLLHAFPNRVLMVSNSAGSAKDRGGIGAEALSLSLGVPVLAHRHAKPACASEVVSFFQGRLGPPKTMRDIALSLPAEARKEEDEAERELLNKWQWTVENGPLCGPLAVAKEKRSLEERMRAAQYRSDEPEGTRQAAAKQEVEETEEQAKTVKARRREKERDEKRAKKGQLPTAQEAKQDKPDPPTQQAKEALRVLVVGDRLFTDTLLARRLALYPDVQALSVITTALPQPHDVRFLRWLENWLSGGKLASESVKGGVGAGVEAPPAVNWSAFVIPLKPRPVAPTLVQKLNPLLQARIRWHDWTEGTPALTLDPRSWRPKPLFIASVEALGRGLSVFGVWVRRGGRWSWARIKAGAAAGRVKAGQAWEERKIRVAREKEERRIEMERKRIEEAQAEKREAARVERLVREQPTPAPMPTATNVQ